VIGGLFCASHSSLIRNTDTSPIADPGTQTRHQPLIREHRQVINRWSGNTDTSSIADTGTQTRHPFGKKISLYYLIGETLSITHSSRRSRRTDVSTSWLKTRSQPLNGGKLCDPPPPHTFFAVVGEYVTGHLTK